MILAKIAIFLLWFGAVIDPIGKMFGIRYLALATALVSLGWLFLQSGGKLLDVSYRGILIVLFSILLPLNGLIIYSLRGGGNGDFIDTSYLASGVLILTSLLYENKRMCDFGVSSLILSTRTLVFFVFTVYALQMLSLDEIIGFFTERDVALIGLRYYSGITLPYIYFVASPLLIFLMAHDFQRLKQNRNFFSLIVFLSSSVAFALTGTRAHIILAVFFAPIYMLLISNRKSFLSALVFILMVMIPVLAVEEVREIFTDFFSVSETNNSMKLALLDGYSEIFSSPLTVLVGQGFNAHEWSLPLREMIAMEIGASKTELTYIELIRVFGIFWAAMLISTMLLLVRSTKNLRDGLSWLYPGIAIFLANAAINPYLFSTNGILPLGLISAIVYHQKVYNIKYEKYRQRSKNASAFQ